MSETNKKLNIQNDSIDSPNNVGNLVNRPSSINTSVPFKPKKPTPLNLYAVSRMDALLALGKSKNDAYQDCTLEYKKMEDQQKLPWILKSLQNEPAYRANLEKKGKIDKCPELFLTPKEKEILSSSHGNQDKSQPKLVVNKVGFAPIRPSPSRLYFNSKLKELLAQGKSEEEIFSLTYDIDDEYQMLPDEQKLKWILLALKKSPAYMSELNQFKKQNPQGESLLSSIDTCILSKAENEIINRLGRVGKESAVSKPIPKSIDADSYQKPKSNLLGFSLFTRQLISSEKFRVLSSADRNMQLCIHWNRMSEKEKDEYNTEAEKFHLNYPLEFSNYLTSFPPPADEQPCRQHTEPAQSMSKEVKRVGPTGSAGWSNLATEGTFLNMNLRTVVTK